MTITVKSERRHAPRFMGPRFRKPCTRGNVWHDNDLRTASLGTSPLPWELRPRHVHRPRPSGQSLAHGSANGAEGILLVVKVPIASLAPMCSQHEGYIRAVLRRSKPQKGSEQTGMSIANLPRMVPLRLRTLSLLVFLSGCALDSEPTPDPEHGEQLEDVAVPISEEEAASSLSIAAASGPATVYLHRHGGTYVAGNNDSASNSSSVLSNKNIPQTSIPAFQGSSSQWAALVSCAENQFAPFNVRITDVEPVVGHYIEIVVGGDGTQVGFGGFGGVAPINVSSCQPIRKAIGYVFDQVFFNDRELCQAVAHEVGHTLSLQHEVLCEDPMTYLNGCGPKSFQNVAAPCGTNAAEECACNRGMQNSVQILHQALGAPTLSCDAVHRVAGNDRFETAAKLSQQLFPGGAASVVLVNGGNSSPDALAAGPLARKLGGPLLLSATDSLPAATVAEISRLGASQVTLIGGTAVLQASVESELVAMGLAVNRIAGADRFATAAQIARAVGGDAGLAYVAAGDDAHLIDALAAAGPAAALGAPILLVNRDSLPAATAEVLSELGITSTVVTGGTAVVSDAVLAQLPNPTRVSGANRYETAVAIAVDAISRGVPSSRVWVARGDLGPDALAAAPAGWPLLLSETGRLPNAAQLFLSGNPVAEVHLLGGEAALAREVEGDICNALLPAP